MTAHHTPSRPGRDRRLSVGRWLCVAVAGFLVHGQAHAQDVCPPGTIPTYNAAQERVVCMPDPDAECPPGQQPTYNAALERVVCIGTGGGSDAQPSRPQSPCPSGQVALNTADGSLQCVDLTVNPAHVCSPPDRALIAGVCQWNCGAGTAPNESAGRCVCVGGMIEAGLDDQGRPTCRIDTRTAIPVPDEPALLEAPGAVPQPGTLPPQRLNQ